MKRYPKLFKEIAKNINDAEKENIGLIKRTNCFVLYNINHLRDSLQNLYSNKNSEDIESGEIKYYFKESIIAATFITNDILDGKNINEVNYIGAKKGWGVLLYDILITISTLEKDGLIPSRGSVSGSAQKVWKKYFTDRDDIKKEELKSKSHNVDYLDCIYTINKNSFVDYKILENSHIKFMDELEEKDMDYLSIMYSVDSNLVKYIYTKYRDL